MCAVFFLSQKKANNYVFYLEKKKSIAFVLNDDDIANNKILTNFTIVYKIRVNQFSFLVVAV